MEPTLNVARETIETNSPKRLASDHDERGRTHGLPFVFWLLEQSKAVLLLMVVALAGVITLVAGWNWILFAALLVGVPLVGLLGPLLFLVYRSWALDRAPGHWEEFIGWRDLRDQKRWLGKKIPMEIVYEAYMAGKLDFKQDLHEVMLHRNQIFRFAFTWGDFKFYFKNFLTQNVTHSVESDRGDIVHVYDRGNDFYNWFLGDTMVYTSGIFRDQKETLEVAQRRKLDTVCKYVQMKPGDRHLDIGCGWGPLIVHAARHFGTRSTGITLAKEQAEWARERARQNGVAENVNVIVDDYRKLPGEKFDKITCLEMAEHVGIKNFQKFLLQVRGMLEDDGIFYLQIAGLRRSWHYEDLVWGLFMAKYIFPGADASCPLGFVVSQAERAGFEVHRVENCGVHYAVTIRKWYDNWIKNREAIVAKYGEEWFRKWTMFLGWSEIIGSQGSSTVFMITMTKNTKNDRSSVSAEEAKDVPFSRKDRWIGPDVIATQQ